MKRIILSLFLICSFFTFAQLPAFSQGLISSCNFPPQCQEVPICTDTADCFKFDLYAPKPLAGDPTKTVIKVMITNYSESVMTHAAFELFNGAGAAVSPLDGSTFRNRYNHLVHNPYLLTNLQDEFPGMGTSIVFKNKKNSGGTFSFGGFEVYYYVVNTSDLNADRVFRIGARAYNAFMGKRQGDVYFNLDNCQIPCPAPVNLACERTDCCFSYSLNANNTGIDEVGDPVPGTTLIAIDPLTNNCGNEVDSVTFSIPDGVNPSVMFPRSTSNNTTFTTRIDTDENVVSFTATSNGFNASTETESFGYNLEDALYRAPGAPAGNRFVTVTVYTQAGSYNQVFDLMNPACGRGPLPVEMMNFDGKALNEGVALNWRTATEENNDRFEVQRSIDGQNFEKIATVKGTGNSSVTREYSFLDKQPMAGINYYRLNQVDFDGTNTFSKVIKVNTEEKAAGHSVQMVPNPCRGDNCAIQLTGFSGNNQISVELRDITGRLVFSKQLPADQTSLVLPKLNTENGIYILSAKDGTNVAYRKVIIQ